MSLGLILLTSHTMEHYIHAIKIIQTSQIIMISRAEAIPISHPKNTGLHIKMKLEFPAIHSQIYFRLSTNFKS